MTAPDQRMALGQRRALPAAGTATVRGLLSGPVHPARLVGAFPRAAYVRLAGGEVVALLTHDAVRLPCGLVLAGTSRQRPLRDMRGAVVTGAGQLRIGALTVRVARLVSRTAPTELRPDPDRLRHAVASLAHAGFHEHGPDLLGRLTDSLDSPARAGRLTRALLGAGSGLTPSGDDVLAGLLVGAHSFGLPAGPLREAMLADAPTATTALSATLLRHASGGETIPQVSSLLLALAGPERVRLDLALTHLIEVGHSSGVALATGVVAAASVAGEPLLTAPGVVI